MSGTSGDQSTDFSILGTTTADVSTDIQDFLDSVRTASDPYGFWTNVAAGTQLHMINLTLWMRFFVENASGEEVSFNFLMETYEQAPSTIALLKAQVNAYLTRLNALVTNSNYSTLNKITGRCRVTVEWYT